MDLVLQSKIEIDVLQSFILEDLNWNSTATIRFLCWTLDIHSWGLDKNPSETEQINMYCWASVLPWLWTGTLHTGGIWSCQGTRQTDHSSCVKNLDQDRQKLHKIMDVSTQTLTNPFSLVQLSTSSFFGEDFNTTVLWQVEAPYLNKSNQILVWAVLKWVEAVKPRPLQWMHHLWGTSYPKLPLKAYPVWIVR